MRDTKENFIRIIHSESPQCFELAKKKVFRKTDTGVSFGPSVVCYDCFC